MTVDKRALRLKFAPKPNSSGNAASGVGRQLPPGWRDNRTALIGPP
jgi:hypothetical protein